MITKEQLQAIRIDDLIQRNLCGILIPLKVSSITSRCIHCGPWAFDRNTGIEIDDDVFTYISRIDAVLTEAQLHTLQHRPLGFYDLNNFI